MMFLPQAILLCFTTASFIVPIYNLYQHIFTLSALAVNLLLNLFNTAVLIFSIKVALEKKDLRTERRVPTRVEAELEDVKNKVKVETINLSKRGILMFCQEIRVLN